MSSTAIGIDITGIQDSVKALDGEGTALNPTQKPAIPPVVIAGVKHFDQPLTGDSALWAIEGRGWTWPEEAHLPTGEFCCRIPVLSMLNKLSRKKSSLRIDHNGGDVQIAKLMGQHLKYLCDIAANHTQPDNHRFLAATVPDDWDETIQSLMLDCLRETRLSDFDLLWRPVALALAWGEQLDPETIKDLSGTSLVVGFGPSTMEASILGLTSKESPAGHLLTPVRRQAGKTHESKVAEFAEQCAQDMARLHHSETLAWQTLWGSDYLWRQLLRLKPELKVFQNDKGEWLYLEQDYKPPELDIWNILKEDLLATFQMLDRSQVVEIDSIIASSLLQALCPIGLNPIALFKTAFDELGYGPQFLQDHQGNIPISHFSVVNASQGAAIYGWRRSKGLPTYYDFLPQIEINAVTKNGTEFIPLVPRQDTIEGGTRFGPHEVDQKFKLPAEAEEIKFFIAKENEEELRKTVTRFKTPPNKDTMVYLLVTQRPGQGHAKVEIIPVDKNTPLGQGTVTLDWKSLEPTGETKEKVLEQLQAEQKLGYPAHGPRKTGLSIWERKIIWNDLMRYLKTEPTKWDAKNQYLIAVNKAKLRLSSKKKLDTIPGQDGGDEYIWLVGSDGDVPAQQISSEQLNFVNETFSSCAELFDQIVAKATTEFLPYIQKSKNYSVHQYKKPFNAIVDLLSWCYTQAPEELSDILLTAMTEKTGNGRAVRAVGRCFTREKHITALFETVAGFYKDAFVRMYWLRALSDILLLRDFAAGLITSAQATRLTVVCLKVLKAEMEKGKFKTKFLSAILLLMLLLRYRIKESDFLGPTSDKWSQLRHDVNTLLSFALKALPDSDAYKKQRYYLNELLLMLDYKGGNQLIAVELSSDPDLESDRESAEDEPLSLESEVPFNSKWEADKKPLEDKPFLVSLVEAEVVAKTEVDPETVSVKTEDSPSLRAATITVPEATEPSPPKVKKQVIYVYVESLLRRTEHSIEKIQDLVCKQFGTQNQVTAQEIKNILDRLSSERQNPVPKTASTVRILSSSRESNTAKRQNSAVSLSAIETYVEELLLDGQYSNVQLRNLIREKFPNLHNSTYSIDDIRNRIETGKRHKKERLSIPSHQESSQNVLAFAENLFKESDISLFDARNLMVEKFGSHGHLSFSELEIIRKRIQSKSAGNSTQHQSLEKESNNDSTLESYLSKLLTKSKYSNLELRELIRKKFGRVNELDSLIDSIRRQVEASKAATNEAVKPMTSSASYSSTVSDERRAPLSKYDREKEVINFAENLFREGTVPVEAGAILRREFGSDYHLSYSQLRAIHRRIKAESASRSAQNHESSSASVMTGARGKGYENQPKAPLTAQELRPSQPDQIARPVPADEQEIIRFAENLFRANTPPLDADRILKTKFGSDYHFKFSQLKRIEKKIYAEQSENSLRAVSKDLGKVETTAPAPTVSNATKTNKIAIDLEKLSRLLLKLIRDAGPEAKLYDLYPKLASLLGLGEQAYKPPFNSASLINVVPQVALSLRNRGLLKRPSIGLWSITESGMRVLDDEPAAKRDNFVSEASGKVRKSSQHKVDDDKNLSRVILKCINEVGGESQLYDVSARIHELMGLTPPGTEPVYETNFIANRIQSTALLLFHRGLLARSRPSYWKITEAGLKALAPPNVPVLPDPTKNDWTDPILLLIHEQCEDRTKIFMDELLEQLPDYIEEYSSELPQAESVHFPSEFTQQIEWTINRLIQRDLLEQLDGDLLRMTHDGKQELRRRGLI